MQTTNNPTCLDGWSNPNWEDPYPGQVVWTHSAGEIIRAVFHGRYEGLTDPLTAKPLLSLGHPMLLSDWLPFEASPDRAPHMPVTISLRQVVDQVPTTQELVWGWPERNCEKQLVRYDPQAERWYDNAGSEISILFWLTQASYEDQCRCD